MFTCFCLSVSDPHLALSVSHLGARSLCRRAGARCDAARRRVEKDWAVTAFHLAIPDVLPEGARHWATLLVVLLLGNIIYVGLVTIAQRRLDWMLGYSSVMHMGYIFLGIASFRLLVTIASVEFHAVLGQYFAIASNLAANSHCLMANSDWRRVMHLYRRVNSFNWPLRRQ